MAAKGSGRIPWVCTLDSQRVKSVLAQINVQLTLPTFNVIDNDHLLGIILYKPVNSCIKRRHEFSRTCKIRILLEGIVQLSDFFLLHLHLKVTGP